MDKKELIFNIHKNDTIKDTIKYKKDLSKQYGLSDDESHDMFVKVVNYQIEVYGYQLQKYNDYVSRGEYFHKNRKAKQREYEKTGRTR